MVGKVMMVPNDNPARISCVSHRLFFTLGPNWVLGVKIVTGVPEAIPVIGSPLVELLRGSARNMLLSATLEFTTKCVFVSPNRPHEEDRARLVLKRIFSMIRPKHAVHEQALWGNAIFHFFCIDPIYDTIGGLKQGSKEEQRPRLY
ncbi:hypothetical protein Pint_33229 [Pistacia integerrima]|uniref:Uncharacterized protein n=1 Tax=Pistacia integerrima TaxID=434235 RepID=A0ACC0XAB7_9ROSI|nr:hypothetical protein Pint_33229 [Pistacia integerrima]